MVLLQAMGKDFFLEESIKSVKKNAFKYCIVTVGVFTLGVFTFQILGLGILTMTESKRSYNFSCSLGGRGKLCSCPVNHIDTSQSTSECMQKRADSSSCFSSFFTHLQ